MSEQGEPDHRHMAVVDAASRCFEQFGIAKTSMQDVADAAGISRRTLYRSFPNRQSLVDLVLRQRLSELVDKVLPQALSARTFDDGFLDAALAAIAYVRATPDLRRLLRETSIDQACKTIFEPQSDLLRLTIDLWQPILNWGRSRGEVRPQLNDEKFIEWTGTIILIYSAREDIPLDELAPLLRDHLLPVVSTE